MEAGGAALEELGHGAGYAGRGLGPVGQPDKGDMKGLTLGEGAGEHLLAQAVGLAELALGTVAVDGMAQAALRHADHHLDPRPVPVIRHGPDDHAQGIGREPPEPLGKEGLDLALQTEMLCLAEGVAESGDGGHGGKEGLRADAGRVMGRRTT